MKKNNKWSDDRRDSGDQNDARIEQDRRQLLSGIGVPKPSPFHVDQFQKDAIDAVTDGHDCLVVAPTGSGKTYIALEAIAAHLRMGTRAVYTTPLKALSNTKFNELKKRFEPEYAVGLLTGDRKIETQANCLVATTEIYRNELYRGSERYSLVVLDEVHFIADAQRGAVWEESIILTPSSCTLLMLSASISNAQDVAAWLQEVRGKPCRVIVETQRTVELRLAFLHPDYGIIPLRNAQGAIHREVEDYYSTARRAERGHAARGRGSRGNASQRPRHSLEYDGEKKDSNAGSDQKSDRPYRNKNSRRRPS